MTPEASREEVVDLVERYKISCLPVTDVDNYLVGVVAYEDVIEAMEDLADETLARMSGTGEKVSSQDPIFKAVFTPVSLAFSDDDRRACQCGDHV